MSPGGGASTEGWSEGYASGIFCKRSMRMMVGAENQEPGAGVEGTALPALYHTVICFVSNGRRASVLWILV